jgi:periplasmic mercuric ion binding protein
MRKTTIIAIVTMMVMVATSAGLYAQTKKSETLKIKTSAVCDMCKSRLEQGLAYEKGIKDVSLDVDTKVLTVNYAVGKTTPDEIRKKVSMLGYDADNVPADKTAYSKLPACCKKDSKKH